MGKNLTPVPVGAYVVVVFQITEYEYNQDGTPMVKLSEVDRNGDSLGWSQWVTLNPDTDLLIEHPSVLWELPHVKT